MVAAPPSLARLLPKALAEAEAAAVVTDAYATWLKPPRYIIYLATEQQFQRIWFGGLDPGDDKIAGFADGGGNGVHYAVVLRTPYRIDLPVLMRHELAHVATLHGSARVGSPWWLVEGIAEHIAYQGKPSPRRPDVAAFVAKGWNGDIADPKNREAAPETSAEYGLGHLAVSCLVDRYGESKMLDFFDEAVRRGVDTATAALRVLRVEWSEINDTCAAEIRRQVR